MKLEIITVGTELVMGHTINTNAALLAKSFRTIGIGSTYQQVVDDDFDRIEEAIKMASKRSNLIVLAGGIGPTHDDLTKEVLAHFLGQDLVIDSKQWDYIQTYFKKQNRSISSLDYKQALTFQEGLCFHTEDGLACGSLYHDPVLNSYYVCLPGPPSELKAMLEKKVLPYFAKQLQHRTSIESLYLNFYGIGESEVATILTPLIQDPNSPLIEIYAKPRHIQVGISEKGLDPAIKDQVLETTADQIISQLKDYYMGQGKDHSIQAYLIDQMKKMKLTLSCAESLTGGQLSASLTSIPGASAVVKGSFVVYQPQAKVDLLGIDPQLIDRYSVYSEQCACAMANQCLRLSGTDLAIALTGVAGPGPDQGHPVGEVYLACASNRGTTEWVKVMIPDRGRDYVRDLATQHAFELIKKTIEQKFAKYLSL
ncbi:competence/damage-inducible protein A [Facklamia miroungae]|uniref:Putative competence-damage inducible protein n=1 Tax=Facklamia miroungae TaxID=120956 RepID=A0A1G7PR64_9LACT|nr:competence/damage-inducible protein A [Facklamia miroungae]NKZ28776.1 competence/damage-inducible protein A [Facklamia miroungae]SDF87900.1 nicotinamide-nucleotide amidase [Facklamia miroungae]